MTQPARELAHTILHGIWTDQDAETVADAYLTLLEEVEHYLLWEPRRKGHAAAHNRLAHEANK